MTYTALFSQATLKEHTVRNRVVFPPVVCFNYSGDDGIVTERSIRHYQEIASGGPGIVIAEATAVMASGRLAPFQLGLWGDGHIPGMSQVAAAIKQEGALALVQIHHAGHLTSEKVSPVAKGPSADEKNPRTVRLSLEEVVEIRDAFIEAARRAQKAGFDGVELHGAHGYLLNQFASSAINSREDEYGGTPERNLALAEQIIRGIRSVCGNTFVIGYRLGANAPTLDDGIRIACHLESAGIDLLHVSHGGNLMNLPRPPAGFDYNWIVYCGTEIRRHVRIPVIVVNDIRTPDRADFLIRNDLADFTALAKPIMSDPAWTNHVRDGQPVNPCFACKPKCRWYEESSLCPARKVLSAANDKERHEVPKG